MIRDEDGQLTGYVFVDLNTSDYGGFVQKPPTSSAESTVCPRATRFAGPANTNLNSGRKAAPETDLADSVLRDFPTALYGLPLGDRIAHADFSDLLCDVRRTHVAMAARVLTLAWPFGSAISLCWHRNGDWRGDGRVPARGCRSADREPASAQPRHRAGRHRRRGAAAPAQAHDCCAVLASLAPILWESGIGSDVMKPIAAPIVGGMITSTSTC